VTTIINVATLDTVGGAMNKYVRRVRIKTETDWIRHIIGGVFVVWILYGVVFDCVTSVSEEPASSDFTTRENFGHTDIRAPGTEPLGGVQSYF
jgi:hypothetical protein